MADDGNHEGSVQRMLSLGWARTELRVVADKIEAHIAPCGKAAVIETLAPLLAVYGVADRSKGEWTAFWRYYLDSLADLPLECLRAGVSAYVKRSTSEFFPKPGPLRELCILEGAPVYRAVGRVRSAMKRIAA